MMIVVVARGNKEIVRFRFIPAQTSTKVTKQIYSKIDIQMKLLNIIKKCIFRSA